MPFTSEHWSRKSEMQTSDGIKAHFYVIWAHILNFSIVISLELKKLSTIKSLDCKPTRCRSEWDLADLAMVAFEWQRSSLAAGEAGTALRWVIIRQLATAQPDIKWTNEQSWCLYAPRLVAKVRLKLKVRARAISNSNYANLKLMSVLVTRQFCYFYY